MNTLDLKRLNEKVDEILPNRLSKALMASIILHVMFFQVDWHKFRSDSIPKAPSSAIPMKIMDSSEVQEILARQKTRQKKAKKKALELKNQIVNNENTGLEIRPKDSRFLGKKNQTFDRQTTAATNGIFKKAGKGTKSGLENAKATAPKQGKRVADQAKKQQQKKVSLSDLGVGRAVPPSQAEKVKALQGQKKLADGEGTPLGIKRGAAGQKGLARNNDFVEDVPLGDMTNLNTVEFKYYGFYHRIRQKLEQHWGNTLREKAEKLFSRGGRLPANENHVTSLRITLNNRGDIVNVSVIGTSGVNELDNAAVESFNKAGPFPNPPQGMLRNGFATIEWGFVVKS